MKKNFSIITTLLLCLSIHLTFAQTTDRILNLQQFDHKIFNWGFYLGVSSWDFALKSSKDGLDKFNRPKFNTKADLALTVGLIGDLRLHKYFTLRTEPSIHFTNRSIYFLNQTSYEDSVRNILGNYFDIPILAKFNSKRIYNIRPYIAGGFGASFNLNSREKSEDDNAEGVFRMKTSNFNYQVEFGFEVYLKFFKLTPAIKGIFMINDEHIKDDPISNLDQDGGWTKNINSMRSRVIVFSLKFQ